MVSIFTATAKAAITAVPKLLTRPWIMRMPKFITDCCRQVNKERLSRLPRAVRSHRQSARPTRRSGKARQVYRASPSPAIYWAITVASAAPMTPMPSGRTKRRSRPIFSTTATPRNSRGVAELPTARRRLAK